MQGLTGMKMEEVWRGSLRTICNMSLKFVKGCLPTNLPVPLRVMVLIILFRIEDIHFELTLTGIYQGLSPTSQSRIVYCCLLSVQSGKPWRKKEKERRHLHRNELINEQQNRFPNYLLLSNWKRNVKDISCHHQQKYNQSRPKQTKDFFQTTTTTQLFKNKCISAFRKKHALKLNHPLNRN